MRYVEFEDAILAELRRNGGGLTWTELRDRLDLPYNRPCPTWVNRMEKFGLERVKGPGRALLWRVGQDRDIASGEPGRG
jgi:hypothetical protein